jgi:Tfp pilus assembly protein PilO
MQEHVFLLTIGFPLVTLIVIFAMKYFSATQQAKARLANDEAYRQMAAQMATTQAETSAGLASMNATLAEVRTRLTALEKLLKEV